MCDHLFSISCAPGSVVDVIIAGGCAVGNGLQDVSVCVWLAQGRHDLSNIVSIATRIHVCDHVLFRVCVCALSIPCAPDCVVDVTIVGGFDLGNGLQMVSVCVRLTRMQLISVA